MIVYLCGKPQNNVAKIGVPLFGLFVLMLYIPASNFSLMLGQFPVLLGWTSTKQWIKCLAIGHNAVTLPVVRLEIATLQSPV